jgi:hypothetical protein
MSRAFCLLLLGCGRVGFGFDTGPSDGRTPSDANPAGDVAVDPDAPDAALCTSLAQFTYNFDDTGSALWMPYTDPGMTLSETGNQLVIPLPSAKSGTAGYFSACMYDLQSQRVFVTATEVPSVGTRTDMYLAVGSQNNAFGVNVTSGSIQAYKIMGANYTALASVTYSATQHKVWQIRESGGQVYYEVSADGTTFTTLFSGAPPFSVSAVQILLFADTTNSVQNPGTAGFAKLDLP